MVAEGAGRYLECGHVDVTAIFSFFFFFFFSFFPPFPPSTFYYYFFFRWGSDPLGTIPPFLFSIELAVFFLPPHILYTTLFFM